MPKTYIATEDTLDDVKDLVSDIKDLLDGGGGGVNPHITVDAPTGSTVTVVNGAKTLTATEHYGIWEFDIPYFGTWTVVATKNGKTKSKTISVTEVKLYTVILRYIAIYGVCWNYGNSSTEMSRLTEANDPNGITNMTIAAEPVAAVGTGAGSSPFDEFSPWAEMDEYNVVNNAVGPKKGEEGFSRSGKDTVVYIPEFYIRVIDDSANSKRYFYIADGAEDGFTKHPGSGKYIGRYETANSSGYVSRSGLAPQVSMTRATARSSSLSKGSHWRQQDIAVRSALQFLYMIEFADWDSQKKIGKGQSDSSNAAAINTGGTDSMTYHTGRAAGTDGKTAVQYRHVENPWGNVWEFVDGFNANERRAYVCVDPAYYADDTASNYTDTGITMPSASGNYISRYAMIAALPWALIPSAVGGSETTYVPDGCWTNTGWRILLVGGDWGYGSLGGVATFTASDDSSGASANLGARLLFVP